MSEKYRANQNVSFGASRVPSHVKEGEIFELDDDHAEIAEKLLESGAISLVDGDDQTAQDETQSAEAVAGEGAEVDEDETKQPAEKHTKAHGAASGSSRKHTSRR